MLALGSAQGTFSAIRGGKFKTGLISGMASKLSGIAMRNQSLDSGTKLTVASMIGGIASKASGGDFFQGAVSAMFVYLFNDGYEDPRLKAVDVPAAMRQSGYETKDNGIKLLKSLEATNDKRKFGAVSLIHSKDNTISMVKVGGEHVSASVGNINVQTPLSYDSIKKSFTLVNVGFNTATLKGSANLGSLKLTGMLHAGGLGINAKIGLSGFIGISIGWGFGLKWNWE